MMSNTVFDEDDFIKDIPKNILERTKENMEVYHIDLRDAFQEAVREFAQEGTELGKPGIMMISGHMSHASMSKNIWILKNIR